MQFGIVTNFSVQMLTFEGNWHSGEVFFTDESCFQLYRADGRQHVLYGIVWASSFLMSKL
jgi:hypothetical protein